MKFILFKIILCHFGYSFVYNDNYDQYKTINIFDFVKHALQQNIISSALGDLINKYYRPKVK